MQINRKSFGTLKSDRYGRVTVMDEWPLRQVLLYYNIKSDKNLRKYECFNTASPSWTPS